jgi:hypothetical protein
MILIGIWAFVVCYFFLLWFATSLELAVAGSILFVFFALKLTFTVLLHIWKMHHQTPVNQPPGVANWNQPPRWVVSSRLRQPKP